MTDAWNLSWMAADGTEIAVDNPGEYTIISVERSLPGQFEQTQNTTESGAWLEPPQVECKGDRSVVTVIAAQGRFAIEIEGLNVEVHHENGVPPIAPLVALTPLTAALTPSELPTQAIATPVICSQCGHQGQSGDRFCAQCGAAL